MGLVRRVVPGGHVAWACLVRAASVQPVQSVRGSRVPYSTELKQCRKLWPSCTQLSLSLRDHQLDTSPETECGSIGRVCGKPRKPRVSHCEERHSRTLQEGTCVQRA